MRQFSLLSALEATAGIGFALAMLPTQDFGHYGFTLAVLSIWSFRARSWSVRWLLVNWIGAFSLICIGLACMEQAIIGTQPGDRAADIWMVCSLAFFAWGLLAGFNGFPFLVEAIYGQSKSTNRPDFHRNTANKQAT